MILSSFMKLNARSVVCYPALAVIAEFFWLRFPVIGHRRFPGSSSSSTAEPRRSPPAAPRRWGGPGRGEGRAATGTGRVQFALSSSPALPHLLPSPRPREKASALRGAAPRGRGRGGSRRRRSKVPWSFSPSRRSSSHVQHRRSRRAG